jgi:hypothetical protein
MAIVFNPVTLPTAFGGGPLQNGKLGPCDLTAVFFPGVGHLSLHPVAAEAFQWMQIICFNETGLHLSTTGAYRSYSEQVTVFLQRYTPTYDPKVNVTYSQRVWDGKRYWLKRRVADGVSSGLAPVAVPGTSNHGYGIAVDCGWWTGVDEPGLKDIRGVTAYSKGWDWIVANAETFGFSWEGARPGQAGWEPWHLRYVLGNAPSLRLISIKQFLGIA